MKTFLLTVAACGLLLTGTAKEPLYRDSSAPLAERVDDLLSRMTLREKLGQLSQPLYRSDDTTLDARITRGEVGSLVVAHGSALAPAERDRLQRIAVERSRLGIPVLSDSMSSTVTAPSSPFRWVSRRHGIRSLPKRRPGSRRRKRRPAASTSRSVRWWT